MAKDADVHNISAAEFRSYKLMSATYQGKWYPEGLLLIDQARREVELRQWVGKKKREQAVVARFRLEPEADVLVDGPVLKVAELSVTLGSPSMANEAANILKTPLKEPEQLKPLAEAEAAALAFLEEREQAVAFLQRVLTNPREALLGVESMWEDQADPLDGVYSHYTGTLGESMEKMNATLAEFEKKYGPALSERMYALVYALGMAQNGLLVPGTKLAQELSALEELGVAASLDDIRKDRSAEWVMQKAHPILVKIATKTN